MIAVRLLRIFLHLVEGLFICALVFPVLGITARNVRLKRWSVQLIGICGVRAEILCDDPAPAPALGQSRALIVANHVSWLDIFVINSVYPSRFVAKSDIRDWPVPGWLCHKAGTIFISRGRVRDVRRIFQDLVASLRAGEHVAFFPEGTTAAQGTILPFHANLFEAAIDAQVPLQPFAVRYVDSRGQLHPAADFIGDMTFAESMMTILRATPITAQLIVLPTIPTAGAHRRDLALRAHDVIGHALHGAEISP